MESLGFNPINLDTKFDPSYESENKKSLETDLDKINKQKDKILDSKENEVAPLKFKATDKNINLQNFKDDSNDLDVEMEEELSLKLEEKIVQIPKDSAFFNSDLVVFKDDINIKMPVNGILESEFKKIENIYQKIVNNSSCFKFSSSDEDFNQMIKDSILTLLTRSIGRKVIEKIIHSYADGSVTIQQDKEASVFFNFRNGVSLSMPLEKEIYPVEIHPAGRLQLRMSPIPSFIVLGHELIHVSHKSEGRDAHALMRLQESEQPYHDGEELLTITGFKPGSQDFKEYDEMNERDLTVAFTDKKHVWFPRYGHSGVGKKPADLSNREEVNQYITKLLSIGTVYDLKQFIKESGLDLQAIVRESEKINFFDFAMKDKTLESAKYFRDNHILDKDGNGIEYHILKEKNHFFINSQEFDFSKQDAQGKSSLEKILESFEPQNNPISGDVLPHDLIKIASSVKKSPEFEAKVKKSMIDNIFKRTLEFTHQSKIVVLNYFIVVDDQEIDKTEKIDSFEVAVKDIKELMKQSFLEEEIAGMDAYISQLALTRDTTI